jgi:hypothetical protein
MSYTPSQGELSGHVRRLQAIEAYLKQIAGNVELGGRAAVELVAAAGLVETAIGAIRQRDSEDWLDR